jgi:hypothetical protein
MAISGDDHVVVTPDYPAPVGAAVAIERAQSPRAPPALA